MKVCWHEDLFKENNLWEIYRISPSVSENKFNKFSIYYFFLFTVLICLFDYDLRFYRNETGLTIGRSIGAVSNVGLTFSSSMLGFLIAGFTIFSSITKPELFAVLAQQNYKNTNLSILKYLFSMFINIFVHYLSFLFVSVFIVIFGDEGGIIRTLYHKMSAVPAVQLLGLYFAFSVLSTWFCVLILKLKSFIWNVYSAVLYSIFYGDDHTEA